MLSLSCTLFLGELVSIISSVFSVPQDTVCRPPVVDTAALQTAPTCTCLEATTQILRRQAGLTMKTTLFSGSSGGFILPQPPGSRSAQRVTCPQSWPPCQVRTDVHTLVLFKGLLLTPARTWSWCFYQSLHLSLDSFRLSSWATGGTNAPKPK